MPPEKDGIPLASGTPFPPSNPEKPSVDNEFGLTNSAARPVDGFAPARGGQPTTFTGSSIGAGINLEYLFIINSLIQGGSFAPAPNTNSFVGIAPNG